VNMALGVYDPEPFSRYNIEVGISLIKFA